MPDGAGRFERGFTCPALLRILLLYINLPLRGSHPLWPDFPVSSSSFIFQISQSYNPKAAVTTLVWANPRSLATTYGITIVFSSSGYLDVSVHRVRLRLSRITCLQHAGLPHSEISGLKVICTSPKLIAACHVLPRL